MGPVRQNPIQRTVSLFICVCMALCTIVAHNIAQNRPDSFPPYPPGYSIFRADRSNGHRGGGVLLLVRDNMGAVEVKMNSMFFRSSLV